MINKSDFCQKAASVLTKNALGEFVSQDILDKLYALTERMLTVNEYMNLTAITDIDEIILKHYADSLVVTKYIPSDASVIDVGCGAGFPSLPLAIARPDVKITALDSTAKRINYINETAEVLGVTNITAVAARAEEAANMPLYREKFDVSCARAVARLNVLSELCIPFVKVGGSFVAMKANAAEELSESQTAFAKLGGEFVSADTFELLSDISAEPRCIISVKKVAQTPKNYPRNNSQIKKKPL